jgi:hypothetical protein
VDYNNKIIFLPLMKKPFEMAYINFLYSGFTLLPLKAKFNLTIARAFLIFYFFLEQCNDFITIKITILKAFLQVQNHHLIMVC